MSAKPSGHVRCATYVRVSREEDDDSKEYNSLESQREYCEHYIALHKADGWFAARHFSDNGFSGKNLDRPAIQELLAEVRAGNIDVVVAYKIDRISRYLPDFYYFWKILSDQMANFVSATQHFDTTTSIGMFTLNMLLSFAQFEREMISERTRDKVAMRARRGLWKGGWVPLGYVRDPKTKLLKRDAQEAELVLKLFNLTVEERNATKVANALNALGYRTKTRVLKGRDGKMKQVGERPFNETNVKEILGRHFYKGIVKYKDQEYESQSDALVPAELWDRANAAIRRSLPRVRGVQDRDAHVTLLKGILTCDHCGTSLTPYPSGKKDPEGNPYVYYSCGHVSKSGRLSKCPVRSIPAKPFESCIINYIGQIGRHPEVIEAAVAAANAEKVKSIKPLKAELAKVEERCQGVSVQLKHCIEATKKMGPKHFTKELQAEAESLAAEKHSLEIEREKIQMDIGYRENVVADKRVVSEALLKFEAVVKGLPREQQKDLIRLIVREVRVRSCDGEKAGTSAGCGTFSTKIRTKWYLVNISFYVNDWIPAVCENGRISSEFGKNWLQR